MMGELEAGMERLIPVQQEPFNAESPLCALGVIPTPTPLFYVRSNFAIPALNIDDWRLRISGLVERELEISYADLQQMPRIRSVVLLECAGNGRRRMVPLPSGVPWDLGAVSTAVFEGVSLATLFQQCGIGSDAVEVVFRGADSGSVGQGRVVHFERSLPITTALDHAVLIADRMNGEPLTPAHGFPVRVVVPGWYAVASVKWLIEIDVIPREFDGHFQAEKYRYIKDATEPDGAPVREMRVRSLITSHANETSVSPGSIVLSGIAWSGNGAIERVEVSMDGGNTWVLADLAPADGYGPSFWLLETAVVHGAYVVMSRATDSQGDTQPLSPIYNELGYGNNVVHAINLRIV
jgi:DMSO/TMAO reductase YedYZ molybdopterin-dependent catalytic subunit